jgi:hypothetical protein
VCVCARARACVEPTEAGVGDLDIRDWHQNLKGMGVRGSKKREGHHSDYTLSGRFQLLLLYNFYFYSLFTFFTILSPMQVATAEDCRRYSLIIIIIPGPLSCSPQGRSLVPPPIPHSPYAAADRCKPLSKVWRDASWATRTRPAVSNQR